MKEELEKSNISVPIVFIESGADEEYPVIRADDYQMGKTLGKESAERNVSRGQIGYYSGRKNGQGQYAESRYRGVTDSFKSIGEGNVK